MLFNNVREIYFIFNSQVKSEGEISLLSVNVTEWNKHTGNWLLLSAVLELKVVITAVKIMAAQMYLLQSFMA